MSQNLSTIQSRLAAVTREEFQFGTAALHNRLARAITGEFELVDLDKLPEVVILDEDTATVNEVPVNITGASAAEQYDLAFYHLGLAVALEGVAAHSASQVRATALPAPDVIVIHRSELPSVVLQPWGLDTKWDEAPAVDPSDPRGFRPAALESLAFSEYYRAAGTVPHAQHSLRAA